MTLASSDNLLKVALLNDGHPIQPSDIIQTPKMTTGTVGLTYNRPFTVSLDLKPRTKNRRRYNAPPRDLTNPVLPEDLLNECTGLRVIAWLDGSPAYDSAFDCPTKKPILCQWSRIRPTRCSDRLEIRIFRILTPVPKKSPTAIRANTSAWNPVPGWAEGPIHTFNFHYTTRIHEGSENRDACSCGDLREQDREQQAWQLQLQQDEVLEDRYRPEMEADAERELRDMRRRELSFDERQERGEIIDRQERERLTAVAGR
jgi:hypothetical protein